MRSVSGAPPQVRRLLTSDSVGVHAVHEPVIGADNVFIVVPGFTQHGGKQRVRQVAAWLRHRASTITVDLRGHGKSSGESTLGRHEIHDLAAVVQWARSLGYRTVAAVGFSMGASVALRHAALMGGLDAVAAVSSPGQWYYRGTPPMRLVHRLVLTSPGRAALRAGRGVRVSARQWSPPYPIDPVAAAARVTVPLLVVHGDRDDYFPVHHGWRIHAAAPGSTFWRERGFGHAESAMTPELAGRIADWLVRDLVSEER